MRNRTHFAHPFPRRSRMNVHSAAQKARVRGRAFALSLPFINALCAEKPRQYGQYAQVVPRVVGGGKQRARRLYECHTAPRYWQPNVLRNMLQAYNIGTPRSVRNNACPDSVVVRGKEALNAHASGPTRYVAWHNSMSQQAIREGSPCSPQSKWRGMQRQVAGAAFKVLAVKNRVGSIAKWSVLNVYRAVRRCRETRHPGGAKRRAVAGAQQVYHVRRLQECARQNDMSCAAPPLFFRAVNRD